MLTQKGDHVYFNHGGSALVGEVQCVGKNGVTVKVGDTQHKVRHERILGHKAKAAPSFRVVDEGLDGAIIEESVTGARRYVHGYRSQAGSDDKPMPANPWRDLAPGMAMAKAMVTPLVEQLAMMRNPVDIEGDIRVQIAMLAKKVDDLFDLVSVLASEIRD